MQGGTTDPAAGSGPEPRVRLVPVVEVADAGDRTALRAHPKAVEFGHGRGHQPLAARLVDGAGAGFTHHDVETGTRGVERGREPDGPSTGDDKVTHGRSRRRTTAAYGELRSPPGPARSAARRWRV